MVIRFIQCMSLQVLSQIVDINIIKTTCICDGQLCVLSGCSSKSDRESFLSFHRLPFSNKTPQPSRKNLSVNSNSGICSRHFFNSHGHILRPDEYPTENLLGLPTEYLFQTP